MYNIKQLTNFDVQDIAPTSIGSIDYIVISSDILGSDNIHKLGYCVNNNVGIYRPIYITINAIPTKFSIGNTGIFEFQEEEWRDVNDDNLERIASVSVSEVYVPAGIPFVLDYCIPV